jgi:Tfp pilus assembly protein PilX
MDLPKKKFKKQKGQVLVIFLLIIVMALAIVLSVASRTITDIRTTSTTDESNRAYFAAEAGIEEGLQRVRNDPTAPVNFTATIDNVNATTVGSYYWASSFNFFVYPTDVEKDSVAQINLLNNINNPASDPTNSWSGNAFTIWWGSSLATNDPNQAIEVSLIYYDTGTANFGIKKYSFDVNTTRGNNFCGSSSSGLVHKVDSVTGLAKDFYYSSSIYILASSGQPDSLAGLCSAPHDGQLLPGQTPVMLRIRPLYNTAKPMPIGIDAVGLPSQGYLIVSTGNTLSGVTRKIQAAQLYNALPSLFDYVLFTNGDLSK